MADGFKTCDISVTIDSGDELDISYSSPTCSNHDADNIVRHDVQLGTGPFLATPALYDSSKAGDAWKRA